MATGPGVVLVAPPNAAMLDPRIAPPLGLLYLVAWAREHGGDTSTWRVVDHATACYPAGPGGPRGHWSHDFSVERCMASIPGGADVYGVQLASMQVAHGRAIARELRRREPGAVLVAGGSHASALPDECCDPWAMHGGHFDVVVEREGEAAFLDVVDRVAAGWRPGRADPPAQGARRAAGTGLHGWVVRGAVVEPLDRLPLPARDLLDWSRYTRRIAGQPATNIVTTRGCPARCTFCQQESLWGAGGLRIQTAPRILREVDAIRGETGIRNLLFLDDSLTARRHSDMVALCEGLGSRGVLWRGWTRANLLTRGRQDDEMLQIMAESGCQSLCVGVEAGSDRVLKAIDKGTTVDQNRRALESIRRAGMEPRCSIMVGNPRETWDDVLALVDFVESLAGVVSDWILSSYVPLPGTPSWDHPERYGLSIDKERARRDGYRHFYVVGGTEQSGLVHRYLDGTGPEDVQRRHDFVQESLLRLAPRDRVRVTVGRVRGAVAG